MKLKFLNEIWRNDTCNAIVNFQDLYSYLLGNYDFQCLKNIIKRNHYYLTIRARVLNSHFYSVRKLFLGII